MSSKYELGWRGLFPRTIESTVQERNLAIIKKPKKPNNELVAISRRRND
jgi:hypothetical protein